MREGWGIINSRLFVREKRPQTKWFTVASDCNNVWIIVVCGLFGSLIALLNASKSTLAIADHIGDKCKTDKSVLLSAWLLGILIFIDDYMNILTISACMKELCDKKRIPRATLAYVIDSTGAPTCVLVPFSTWAVFYAKSFYEQQAVNTLYYGTAIDTYLRAIPFMFYAWIAVILVPMVICGIVPIIGPLKKEYADARTVQIKGANLKLDESDAKSSIMDFIIPIGVMIVVTVIWENMLWALMAAIISCLLLYVPRKIMTFTEYCNLVLKGFSDLVPTLGVLLLAFFMKQACMDINLPEYVVQSCLPYVNGKSFPAVAFLLVSILAFATGDSWGVPAICIPIIIPLAAACNAHILLTMGAIVSGGVFCSHACFYSDATVLTSQCCGIDNMIHARTQMPYAGIAFLISFLIYLILGLIL